MDVSNLMIEMTMCSAYICGDHYFDFQKHLLPTSFPNILSVPSTCLTCNFLSLPKSEQISQTLQYANIQFRIHRFKSVSVAPCMLQGLIHHEHLPDVRFLWQWRKILHRIWKS